MRVEQYRLEALASRSIECMLGWHSGEKRDWRGSILWAINHAMNSHKDSDYV